MNFLEIKRADKSIKKIVIKIIITIQNLIITFAVYQNLASFIYTLQFCFKKNRFFNLFCDSEIKTPLGVNC